ncbi:MAG: isochorismatase family protein, partial [Pseudomonadota bacterium]
MRAAGIRALAFTGVTIDVCVHTTLREANDRGYQSVLIGDACHPMLPFMAQGAAMGIEDATVLARCLDAEAAIPAALTRFERLRRPRTTRVQAVSRANGRMFHRADGLARTASFAGIAAVSR